MDDKPHLENLDPRSHLSALPVKLTCGSSQFRVTATLWYSVIHHSLLSFTRTKRSLNRGIPSYPTGRPAGTLAKPVISPLTSAIATSGRTKRSLAMERFTEVPLKNRLIYFASDLLRAFALADGEAWIPDHARCESFVGRKITNGARDPLHHDPKTCRPVVP
jgi:hypothetical protein